MKITQQNDIIVIQREENDKKEYKDSTLWFHMKKAILAKLGISLIVASHEKDGNMYGDHYYIRSSMHDIRAGNPYYSIYDTEYAVRDLLQAYNNYERIIFPFRAE